MSSADIKTLRAKFEELWPAVVEEVAEITGREAMDVGPTAAFYHCIAVARMHSEAAHQLADNKIEEVLQNDEAMMDFLRGERPDSLTAEQIFELAVVFSFVMRALGYGTEDSSD